MGRPKGPGRPPKRSSQAEQLLAALNFASVATGEDEWSDYAQLGGNYCVAFNGQMAAGFPIAEELSLCPHLDKLKTALERCGKSLAITETPTGQLSVKGESLRAVVPCFAGARPLVAPDMPTVQIDNRIKEAFRVCGALANEKANEVMCASLLLEAFQCTSTNRAAMIQFWHGIDLPPHMVVPKSFAAAVVKADKPLTGFGFTWSEQLNSPSAITFWFEGGAWIKTQCYNNRWNDVSHIFGCQIFPVDTPPKLFEAIEAVAQFNEEGEVVFVENGVQSHDTADMGAQFEVPGLQGGKLFDGKLIGQAAPWAKQMDLTTFPDRAFFVGGEANTPVRGVLMAKGPRSQS